MKPPLPWDRDIILIAHSCEIYIFSRCISLCIGGVLVPRLFIQHDSVKAYISLILVNFQTMAVRDSDSQEQHVSQKDALKDIKAQWELNAKLSQDISSIRQ